MAPEGQHYNGDRTVLRYIRKDPWNTGAPPRGNETIPCGRTIGISRYGYPGVVLKSTHEHRLILAITDLFSKIKRAICLQSTTAPDVAMALLVHWIYPYGLPLQLLTGNRPQFVAKFFGHVCSALGLKHLFIAASHPRSNGKAEWFNRNLAFRLSHYVADHQLNLDHYVQPLVYAYKNQVYRSTGTTPFDLALSRAPPSYMADLQYSNVPEDIAGNITPAEAKRYSRKCIDTILKAARTRLDIAQKRNKEHLNKAIWFTPHFSPGNYVQFYRPPKEKDEAEDIAAKFLPRSTWPYKILKSTGHTVTIDLDGF